MLVLTRRKSQQIRIGDDVVVTILNTKNNVVKIGIDAPLDVRHLRDEKFDSIADHSQTLLAASRN